MSPPAALPAPTPARATAPSHSWVDDEPGLAVAGAELRRFGRRARRRPLVLLGLALAITAAWTVRRILRKPLYQAQIVFRIVENEMDRSTAVEVNTAVRAWVNQVALSHKNLVPLIRERGLYEKALERGPDQAVEQMREDIEVEVWRNYFLELREANEQREARVALRYQHVDPETAFEVLRAIGDLVVLDQQARRRAAVEAATERAQLAVELARHEVETARKNLEARRRSPGGINAAEKKLELAEALEVLTAANARLHLAEQQHGALQLRRGMERRNLAMAFQIVDPPQRPKPERGQVRAVAASAASIFVVLLPFLAMAAGAFDRRIYDRADLQRLGLVVLGQLGPFPGWQDGALDGRRQVRHRVR